MKSLRGLAESGVWRQVSAGDQVCVPSAAAKMFVRDGPLSDILFL